MANLPLVFADVLGGGVLLVAGISGNTIADVLDGKVAIQPLSTGGGGGGGAGTYVGGGKSPFPGGFTPGRLDQGYDGTVHGSAITSPVSGTVTYASSSFSNWGGYVEVKADGGNIPGLGTDTLYFAEGLAPTVKAGDRVTAGQQIARTAVSPWNGITGNIEWGPARPGSVGTPTDPLQAGRDSVLAFAHWAESVLGLPAPSSTSSAGSF